MSQVTTLTSCYKGGKFLQRFIKNVESQSYNNLSLNIELVKPTRKEIYILKKNSKNMQNLEFNIYDNLITLPEAWNKTIQTKQSDYFCIWNVDDLRTEDSIESMATALDDNPKCDFVYGNYYIVDKFGSQKGGLIDEQGREDELQSSMILGPFFMFRAKVLDSIGLFDEQLLSGADYDFAMRLSRNFKGIHIDKNLGYYLNTSSGLSTRKNSVQELERTVVEIRYNIPVINKNLISEANDKYRVHHLKHGDSYKKV
tara:strand:+ start:2028 stop:2795 length:768 start_codon:yes stop_codon:yes gene_type:complete